MPEPEIAQAAPPSSTPAPAPAAAAPAREPDLMSKINEFRKSTPAPQASSADNSEFFDFKQIESIADPIAKEIAIKAYKSMQGDYTRGKQELANLRKDLESKTNENWTPDRIQQLLNNPQFVQAAQQIVPTQNPANSGLTDEEYSALSEPEKAKISMLENKINHLEQMNFNATLSQKDAQLMAKYDDYDPKAISNAIRDLSQIPAHELREHVYKSYTHDKHMQEAYELGKQEALKLNQQKASAISQSGYSTTSVGDVPKREQAESSENFFLRLARNRMNQNGNGQTRR